MRKPDFRLSADLCVLLFLTIFILSYFPRDLLAKTTINGGDTGSHYPTFVYLKEVLLPQGKIMGWMPGNYAGFPLFYHYFPLPFLIAAALSFFISMEASFKLATILGALLLPCSLYFAFRCLEYEFPVPILAAIFSLPFLFNQGNSMWGGNIPSTLAGEFCYSLGVAFVFLLIGSLYRGIKEQKLLIFNSVLIFLIGFSHMYTLIFSLIVGAYFLFPDPRRNIKYLCGVYALGFLYLAFWFLPLLGNAAYTTTFVFRWTLHSIFEVFPVVLIPFVGLSILAYIFDLKDKRTCYFSYLALACAVVYLVGPLIGILDIRFVPFAQLLLAVFGATFLQGCGKQLRALPLLPFIALLVVIFWVTANTTYIRSWANWNYSGYERKQTWSVFHGINEFLKHSDGGPAGRQAGRVEWEHTPFDEALGSIRSYETLPYFAGRQTLEGIHMLGAVSAPFVFYIESETSYWPCNPLQNYSYSPLDLKGGLEHFKLFNVSQFVVRTPQVKAALKAFPEFKLEKSVGDYNIYRLTTNPGEYVSPLKNEPVLFLTNNWRPVAYAWFARRDLNDIFLVFKQQADARDKQTFHQIITDFSQLKKVPYPAAPVSVSSTLGSETIDIETSALNRPLLIKVSYHPNWQITGADKIYLVSPSFMLIYPNSHKIHLSFEYGFLGHLGVGLTLFGILLAAASPLWFKRLFP
jgi:hypothetical protein